MQDIRKLENHRTSESEDAGSRAGSEARHETELAEKRTRLSQERTFSSWLRTALTFVAAGVGIAELFDSGTDPRLTTAIGVVLVLTGGAVFAIAFVRYGHDWVRARRGLRFFVLSVVLLAGVTVSVLLALMLLLR